MIKPRFQRRQEETRGSVMVAMRRNIKLAHVLTGKVKALCYQERGSLAR
jgi:hypothetical protein